MAKDKKKINPENMTDEANANVAENAENVAEELAEETAAKAAAMAAEEETEAGEGKDELAEMKDRYLRLAAEYDNYRKRTEKEKTMMYGIGAMSVLEKLLPTVDNFERGLKDAPADAFAEGMSMIYKNMMKALEDIGVKPIEAEGKPFDPNYHNAVMHEEDDSGQENIVSEELQKGYTYKDNILRHSMVKVLN